MYSERYIFTQLMSFFPRYQFDKCVKKYNWNHRVRSFTCWEQFLAMSFWQLTYRESLRDLVICLNSQKNKLYHLGFSWNISRTTLARVNENRDWRIYADFAQVLIKQARELYSKDSTVFTDIESSVYALDASTIDLCLSVFKWAKFRKHKAAIKLHTLIDLRWNIPTFIHITNWKCHDVKVLDVMEFEVWAFYIMDRWYFDFKRLYNIHLSSAFFVIRLKVNTKWERVYSTTVDKNTGVKCDQIIKLSWSKADKQYPDKLRRIKYYDEQWDKTYEFITNNFVIDAKVIADLYKSRWQVELFFKWIKQHLRIKVFWWESSNAVKTQVWISVCTYLLVAIVKKKIKLKESLYEILQILSINSCDKIPLESLFNKTDYKNPITRSWEQLKIGNI